MIASLTRTDRADGELSSAMSSARAPGLEGMLTIPPDLAYALQSEPEARRAFERLPAAGRRSLLDVLADDASPLTRRRAIAVAVDRLRSGDAALTA